jgi:DNA-binding transcriptional ArsR family regulator
MDTDHWSLGDDPAVTKIPSERNEKLILEIQQYLLYNKTDEHILNCFIIGVIHMTLSVLDEHAAALVAELFRAFSDTSRVRIMSALVGKEKNVTELAKLVGVTESAISHHMRGLRQLRIVRARRDGREVYYSIIDPHIVTLFQQGVDHITAEE